MSEWKQGAAARRDARHTKDEPRGVRPRSKYKNTKKWCRGKVGVEHTPEWRSKYTCWHEFVCTACGKVLDWVWGEKPNAA